MNKFGKIFLKIISVLIAIVSVLYVQTEIYSFTEPQPFSGPHLYNPYTNWNSDSILKANLHAHTTAWGGATNGKNSPKELIEAYQEKDYDIIGISNYFNINTDFDTNKYYIPLYEHGLNILKTHKQAINPKEILYFDFPLFQNTSQKQQIINKLKEKGALVSINHPKFMNGHTFEDLKLLTGYHFIEVLNHYRVSDKYWDKALSAGKLSWILGNDDVHDLSGKWNHFVMWNMIKRGKNKNEVLANLIEGKSYGMRGSLAQTFNQLKSCEILNDTLKIIFKNYCDSIILIGQDGSNIHSTINTNSISLPAKSIESYVRCKAGAEYKTIFLNPIIRYDGVNIPYNYKTESEINWLQTWLYRIILILINLALLWLAFFRKTKQINN
jgi:hypothetical protein